MKTKTKKKKVVRPTAIPKDLRPMVLRKFLTKDRTKRFLVTRLPNEAGVATQVVARGLVSHVRDFKVPTKSEVPTPVLIAVERELATWWTRMLARKGLPPSQKQERGRRRRYIKREMAKFRDHQSTKIVVDRLKKPMRVPTAPQRKSVILPYIFIYDPRLSLGDTTFRVHTAYCCKLDKERRKAVRDRGGESWVVEAKSVDEALAKQMAEFEADDMGYDAGDFTVCDCQGE